MKLSPYVSELSLYDIAGTPGVAADVSHINSKASVKGEHGLTAGNPCRRPCAAHAWSRGVLSFSPLLILSGGLPAGMPPSQLTPALRSPPAWPDVPPTCRPP